MYNPKQQAKPTFLWHDYETSGLNAVTDRPMQFAGIRTDLELNQIGEPIELFCKLADDVIPSPEACLLTGVTPGRCEQFGVSEAEFANKINSILGEPGTCGVGYNTIMFDDEFTRQTLYRNLMDPYEREWNNGNSRWDLIDLVRAVYALRPNVMEWIKDENGKPSMRLEVLAEANSLPKVRAHDAVSDVETTIALAKKIKDVAPEFFHFYHTMKAKKQVLAEINLVNPRPVLHVNRYYGAERDYASIILPICTHPTQQTSVIAVDLLGNIDRLIDMDPGLIADELFAKKEDREGLERLPVSTFAVNRSPFVCSPDHLKTLNYSKMPAGFSREKVNQGFQKIMQDDKVIWKKLANVLQEVYASRGSFASIQDADAALYAGFLSPNDKQLLRRIKSRMQAVVQADEKFDNGYYNTLIWRYRARNQYDSLSDSEKNQWHYEVVEKLMNGSALGALTLPEYMRKIQECKESPKFHNDPLLAELEHWGERKLKQMQAWGFKAKSPSP